MGRSPKHSRPTHSSRHGTEIVGTPAVKTRDPRSGIPGRRGCRSWAPDSSGSPAPPECQVREPVFVARCGPATVSGESLAGPGSPDLTGAPRSPRPQGSGVRRQSRPTGERFQSVAKGHTTKAGRGNSCGRPPSRRRLPLRLATPRICRRIPESPRLLGRPLPGCDSLLFQRSATAPAGEHEGTTHRPQAAAAGPWPLPQDKRCANGIRRSGSG